MRARPHFLRQRFAGPGKHFQRTRVLTSRSRPSYPRFLKNTFANEYVVRSQPYSHRVAQALL